ncbi:MAG: ABC transporter ATP-binding protein [Myxococcales bacterium]|nr:ABC transporter ATP-binding protein [Myxococcales bacterium]
MNETPPPQHAIVMRDVTRRFGAFTAVDGVSLTVRRGSIFGMLGPNGSGKTTAVRMICGLLAADAGEIWLDGVDVRRDPAAIRTRFGYMSQKFSLYTDLTVRENLRFYGRIYGIHGRRLDERVDSLVAMLGLGPYLDRRSGALSGGWKQRLALAAALIHEPSVLFLDEPTAGIDPVARRDLWGLLFDLSRDGVTIFVTTHYMDEAERCSEVAYLYLSKLLAVGTPSSLKALPEVTGPGEQWVELHCSSPAAALGTIRELDGVHDATVFGDTLHLRVGSGWSFSDAERAMSRLGQSDIHVRDVQPGLEDVFVSLTRHAERMRNV